jgi:hypothetical protein
MNSEITLSASEVSGLRRLQALGILCGLAAGAWLGAAEASTKLVTIGVSRLVISLIMVVGVFLARGSVLRPHPRHGLRSYSLANNAIQLNPRGSKVQHIRQLLKQLQSPERVRLQGKNPSWYLSLERSS